MRLRNVKTNIAAATVLFGSCAALPHVTSTEKTHLSSVNDEDLSQDSAVLDSQITVEDSEQATDEETVAPTDTSTSNKSGYKPSNIVNQFIGDVKLVTRKFLSGKISENDALKSSVMLCEDAHDSIKKAQSEVSIEVCKKIFEPHKDDLSPESQDKLCNNNDSVKDADKVEMVNCLDSVDEKLAPCVVSTYKASPKPVETMSAPFNFTKNIYGYKDCIQSLLNQDHIYYRLGYLTPMIALENAEDILFKALQRDQYKYEKYLAPLRKPIYLTPLEINSLTKSQLERLKELQKQWKSVAEPLRKIPIRENTDNKPENKGLTKSQLERLRELKKQWELLAE